MSGTVCIYSIVEPRMLLVIMFKRTDSHVVRALETLTILY